MPHRPARHFPQRGTRLCRADATGPDRLEALSAAFALLAQRRARLLRQIALLDRQQSAARASLARIEAKLAELSGHVMALPVGAAAATVAPPSALPPRPTRTPKVYSQSTQPERGPEPPATAATAARRSRAVLLTY